MVQACVPLPCEGLGLDKAGFPQQEPSVLPPTQKSTFTARIHIQGGALESELGLSSAMLNTEALIVGDPDSSSVRDKSVFFTNH